MDAARTDRAIIVGWSLGVNVAFEMALSHPERVAGVLAVAGVPGGTFSTLFPPLNLPRPVRRPVGLLGQGAKLLARVGPVVRFIEGGLPPSEAIAVPAWHPLARRLQHAEAGVRHFESFPGTTGVGTPTWSGQVSNTHPWRSARWRVQSLS